MVVEEEMEENGVEDEKEDEDDEDRDRLASEPGRIMRRRDIKETFCL